MIGNRVVVYRIIKFSLQISKQVVSTVVLMSIILANSLAAQWSPSRVDSHAPIGVMGDHRHEKGEVMFSYRFMNMLMEGMRDGTTSLNSADVTAPNGSYNFMVTPTRMPMTMHMGGAMFGLSDEVTLMAMVPYLSNSMDHVTRTEMSFTTKSSGIGDLKAGAMIGLGETGNQSFHMNAMLSIPTGSITQQGVTPMSNGMLMQLPYHMQIGSGTWDFSPAITWLGQRGENVSWGVQGGGTIRLGTNDRNWALGNRIVLSGWLARVLNRNVSAALRLNTSAVGDIEGKDAMANPMMVPTARTDLSSGKTVKAGFSLNFYLPQAKAFRIAFEGFYPLYRNLDGPQLETDWSFILGLQVVPVR